MTEANPYFFNSAIFLKRIISIPPENTKLATFKAMLVVLILTAGLIR